jgi:hypothetical protein
LGLAALSVSIPPLSVPAVVLTLIAALSFPAVEGRDRLLGRAATGVAVLGCAVGLARFATTSAMQGIVEMGEGVARDSELSRLRAIVTAEDAARQTAPWDPDRDGVGSALLVTELTGVNPLPIGTHLSPPLLNDAYADWVETPLGRAAHIEGFLFIVCLPEKTGGWTARPDESVDAERAERRFVAYAWPTEAATGVTTTFFADEHERLLVHQPPHGMPSPYLGAARPPACDAALVGSPGDWVPWKNKHPRQRLPGDK